MVFMNIGYNLIPDVYNETAGVVMSIKAIEGSDRQGRNLQNEILVVFIVNGVQHEQVLLSRKTGIEVGQTLKTFYNPDNPIQIRDFGSDPYGGLLFGSVGLIFFLFGFKSLYKLSVQKG
jgi:hypothetical protein